MLPPSPSRSPRTRLAPLAGLILACAACGQIGAADTPRLKLGAWVTYWDFDRGMDRLSQLPGALEDVFFFVAELGPDRRPVLAVQDEIQDGALRQLAGRGQSWLTVVNDTRPGKGAPAKLKDADAIHRILVDEAERAAHRRSIVELAVRRGFAGVDIDYENLMPEDRDRFSAFARELASDLAGRGLRLSITVQPKRQESRSVGPGAADWSQLCAAAERIQVMLYNLHSSRTGPGPLAEKAWVAEVMGFARSQCDPARLVPVLKLGGMDWGPRGTRDVSYADAAALLSSHGSKLQREPQGTPFFRYDDKDGAHTVYFEDAESIVTKASWLEELGYHRVVLWSLGREDPDTLPRLLGRSAPLADFSRSTGRPRQLGTSASVDPPG